MVIKNTSYDNQNEYINTSQDYLAKLNEIQIRFSCSGKKKKSFFVFCCRPIDRNFLFLPFCYLTCTEMEGGSMSVGVGFVLCGGVCI